MKNKDKVTTTVGGILTAAIMTLTLGYFIMRLQALSAGSDPTINNNIVHNYFGANKGLNLYEANHSFAISVTGYNDNLTKYDPRYVRMIAQYYNFS